MGEELTVLEVLVDKDVAVVAFDEVDVAVVVVGFDDVVLTTMVDEDVAVGAGAAPATSP